MMILLKTRCGCTREMAVPYPAPREIVIGLTVKKSFVISEESLLEDSPRLRIQIRRFFCTDLMYPIAPGKCGYLYEEVE